MSNLARWKQVFLYSPTEFETSFSEPGWLKLTLLDQKMCKGSSGKMNKKNFAAKLQYKWKLQMIEGSLSHTFGQTFILPIFCEL